MKILVETSARHIHLSQRDADILFGICHIFRRIKSLSQPGEYASKETVRLVGKKSSFGNLRVIMPIREKSQVEVSMTDCYCLGIQPVIRLSGDTSGAPKLVVKGPKGKTSIPVIVAKRHLHLSPSEAKKLKIKNNQKLKIKIKSSRSAVFDEIIARVGSRYRQSLHLDADEANAAGIDGKAFGELV